MTPSVVIVNVWMLMQAAATIMSGCNSGAGFDLHVDVINASNGSS